MMRLVAVVKKMPYASAIGVAFGLLVAHGFNAFLGIYDAVLPVVEMKGELVSRDGDMVVLHITGRKNRECQYGGLQAYSVDVEGERRDALYAKVGQAETARTKPIGVYDIGFWRVWPVTTGSVGVVMYVQHYCNGRMVMTQIAEVGL